MDRNDMRRNALRGGEGICPTPAGFARLIFYRGERNHIMLSIDVLERSRGVVYHEIVDATENPEILEIYNADRCIVDRDGMRDLVQFLGESLCTFDETTATLTVVQA